MSGAASRRAAGAAIAATALIALAGCGGEGDENLAAGAGGNPNVGATINLADCENWNDASVEERFGTTDRAAIGEIVFADRDELAWLEALLHPRVVARRDEWLAGIDAPLAVAEIPLLYETGGEREVDAVVVVTAPAEVRRALPDAHTTFVDGRDLFWWGTRTPAAVERLRSVG